MTNLQLPFVNKAALPAIKTTERATITSLNELMATLKKCGFECKLGKEDHTLVINQITFFFRTDTANYFSLSPDLYTLFKVHTYNKMWRVRVSRTKQTRVLHLRKRIVEIFNLIEIEHSHFQKKLQQVESLGKLQSILLRQPQIYKAVIKTDIVWNEFLEVQTHSSVPLGISFYITTTVSKKGVGVMFRKHINNSNGEWKVAKSLKSIINTLQKIEAVREEFHQILLGESILIY